MPGIPKSKGCKNCKRRKIKCDEHWPTCTPCRRSCSRCPGPSSVFKFVHNGQHSTLGNTMVQRPSVKSQADNTNQKEGLEMLRQSFPGAADDGWYGAFRLNGSTRSPISPTETHNAPHQHKRQISPNYVFPSLAAEISEDLDDFDQSMIGRLPNFRAAGFHQDPSRRRDFLLVDPNLFPRTGPREPLQQWQQRPGVPVDR